MDVTLMQLPLDRIRADAAHPEPTPWLIESMGEYGLFQPIKASALDDGSFEVRSGRRRVGAARQLGWAAVDAYVVPAGSSPCPTDLEAIIANVRCENLEQLHMAHHARRLIREEGCTQTELARQIRVSQPSLSRMVQVVECEELAKAVKEDGLAFSAAKALVSLAATEREALLAELRREAAETGKFPPVRQIENAVRRRQGRGPGLELDANDLPLVVEALRGLEVRAELRVVQGRQRRIDICLELTERLEERLRRRLGAGQRVPEPSADLPVSDPHQRSRSPYSTWNNPPPS